MNAYVNMFLAITVTKRLNFMFRACVTSLGRSGGTLFKRNLNWDTFPTYKATIDKCVLYVGFCENALPVKDSVWYVPVLFVTKMTT